jgi:hypothetical protein
LAALAREIQLAFVGEIGGSDLLLTLDGDAELRWPLAELREARSRGLADAIG